MTERKAHRKPEGSANTIVDVQGVRFGHDPFPVIAGPASVESESQVMLAAEIVADRGASLLRGGTFRSQSSPYAYAGMGRSGLALLKKAGQSVGLPILTEVGEIADAEVAADHADMLEIGPANMQNFELLRVVGRTGKPVLLNRGPSATIDEWLWSAEYLLAEGNDQIVMCERGIRTFEHSTQNTLDISAVPVVKEKSHLPVIVDPSHAAGHRSLVTPLALAAQGVGADGLAVEVHPSPDEALSDQLQQLDGIGFGALMDALGISRMRQAVDIVDREIVRLMARRRGLSLAIGRVKAVRGMPVQIPDREAELLAIIRDEAALQGLDPSYVERIFKEILAESRAAQWQERQVGPPALP
jgi:3-deoxy-7-phosphoheptulonate synthase